MNIKQALQFVEENKGKDIYLHNETGMPGWDDQWGVYETNNETAYNKLRAEISTGLDIHNIGIYSNDKDRTLIRLGTPEYIVKN